MPVLSSALFYKHKTRNLMPIAIPSGSLYCNAHDLLRIMLAFTD